MLVWLLQMPPFWAYWPGAILVVAVGVHLCGRAGQLLGRLDPPSVVWDEIAAFPIVLAGTELTLMTAVLAFGWFRLFDILKPYPIKLLERFPRGWGVMADDLMAGVYAGVALQVTLWLIGLSTGQPSTALSPM